MMGYSAEGFLASLKSIIRSPTSENFFYLTMNQGTNVLVALLVSPILYQRLGEEQYGLITLALTWVMLFSILVNYGFSLNGPKRLALLRNDAEGKAQLINEVMTTRIVLCFSVVLILASLIGFFGAFSEYNIIVLFSTIILVSEAIFPMFILQGFDKLAGISKANVISKLLYLFAILLVIKQPKDAKWANFLFGGSALLVNVVLVFIIYKTESIRLEWISFRRIAHRLTENFHFFFSTMAAYVLVNGGYILLSNFVSNTELGRYALAQRIALLLRMVPAFLTQSILQKASILYHDDKSKFKAYLKNAYRNGLLINLLIGVAFFLAAPLVVRIVAGEYVEYSTQILRVLCFLPFIAMLNVSNMIRILVAEHKHVMSKAIWITTVFMLVIGSVACHYYGGMGLAVALLISELFNYVIHSYLLRNV